MGIITPPASISSLQIPSFVTTSQPELRRYRAKLGKFLSGKSVNGSNPATAVNALNIACVGHSETLGTCSGGTPASPHLNAKVYSWPRFMAALLNAKLSQFNFPGGPVFGAADMSCFGDGHTGTGAGGIATFLQAEPRIGFSSPWTQGVQTLGGYQWLNSTAADTTPITFKPNSYAWDTVDIYDVSSYQAANMTVDIGGATQALVNSGASTGNGGLFRKSTFSFALGNNTVNLKKDAASPNPNAFVTGIACRDSTKSLIYVHNMGSYAAQAQNFNPPVANNNAYPMVTLPLFAADLVIFQLDVNEYINGITPAVFKANYGPLIAAALAVSDVILVISPNANVSYATQAAQDAMSQAVRDLAVQYGVAQYGVPVPVIDTPLRFGNWAQANALGMHGDIDHPSAAGYLDMARAHANAILP